MTYTSLYTGFWEQFEPEEAERIKEYQRTAHLQHNAHVTAYNFKDVVPMWKSSHKPTRDYWREKLGIKE